MLKAAEGPHTLRPAISGWNRLAVAYISGRQSLPRKLNSANYQISDSQRKHPIVFGSDERCSSWVLDDGLTGVPSCCWRAGFFRSKSRRERKE
jgi:hypothetical protein